MPSRDQGTTSQEVNQIAKNYVQKENQIDKNYVLQQGQVVGNQNDGAKANLVKESQELANRLKVHGTEEHPEVAASLNNIGAVLESQGRYTEASAHYERSLAIKLKVHGTEEHPDVALSLNNMGTVLFAQGRYAEAATHYERSLAIKLKVHGTEEHPDVTLTRRNLQSLRYWGQWRRALSRVCHGATILLLWYLVFSHVKPLLMPFENRDEL